MKTRVIAMLAALTISLTATAAGDILAQLKVSPDDARRDVLNSMLHGYPPYGDVAASFKAAPPAARAALVEQMLSWARSAVQSKEFAALYEQERQASKPQAPEFDGTPEEELKRKNAERRAELEESRRTIAQVPPQYRKDAEAGYRQALAQTEKLERDPKMQKMMLDMIVAERKQDMDRYEKDLARWTEDYPADFRPLLAARLKEFLDQTAGVDYGAALVESHGRKRFARPDYERKPWQWKLAYRVGQAPVEKARAFAQRWLAELK